MALIHDIGESIIGDITPHCGVSEKDKFEQEKGAMEELSKLLSKDVGEELLGLWNEYEEQKTPEAKAVKDLDRFDMVAQAFEYEQELQEPRRLQEFFDSTKGKFQTETVKQWVSQLEKQRKEHK